MANMNDAIAFDSLLGSMTYLEATLASERARRSDLECIEGKMSTANLTTIEKLQQDGEILHFGLFRLRNLCRIWAHRAKGESPFDSTKRARLLPMTEEVRLADSHARIVDGYFETVGVPKPLTPIVGVHK